jgi:hypothetical protein
MDADRRLGVGVERLRRAVEREGAKLRTVIGERTEGAPGGARPAGSALVAGPVPFVEQSLLALLVAAPALAEAAHARIPEAWITHPTARGAWAVVGREPLGDPARWCEAAEGEVRALLSALSEEATAPDALERALEDHARRLEARALEVEREAIGHELARAEGESAGGGRERLERLQWVAARLHALGRAGAGDETAAKGEAE